MPTSCVFDPATVIDHSTYIEPFQYSTGIIHVLVNGKLALENGQPARELEPGRALRHGRSSSTGKNCKQSRQIKKTGQRTDPKQPPLPWLFKIRSTGRLVANDPA